jgi:hypothetical protein
MCINPPNVQCPSIGKIGLPVFRTFNAQSLDIYCANQDSNCANLHCCRLAEIASAQALIYDDLGARPSRLLRHFWRNVVERLMGGIPHCVSNGRFISRFVSQNPTICVATCALFLCCQGLISRVMCQPTRPLTQVESGHAFQRLIGHGWTPADIATKIVSVELWPS